MDHILDRVKVAVRVGQQLTRLLGAYRKLCERPGAAPAARERELERIAAAAAGPGCAEVRTELEAWLAEERARVAAARDELRFGFGSSLAAALGGLGLEPRGQLPVVRAGLFSLRVDFEAGAAALYWGPEVEKLAAGIALTPDEIARAVREQQALLRKRAIEPARLAGLLRQAYRRWSATGSPGPAMETPAAGARAPIVALLGELVQLIQPDSFRSDPVRRRFVEYPRVQFSHDLYRMRLAEAAGGRLPRLHVATFDSTTSKARAVWVPDNEQGDGTNYSYLSYPEPGRAADDRD